MKKFAFLLAIVFCLATIDSVQAQMTKKEAKEWKKKKKKTSPEQFKRMFEENASLKQEVSSLQGQLASIQSNIGDKDAKIAELTQRNREMESELSASQRAIAEATEAAAQSGPVVDESGVVFKVQIGAFRNKDLSKYFENNPNFSGETEADGTQKITLGMFRDYWEADNFKKYLREMGVNDAWIVPYKDGQRVAMKEVLEGVI
jgi:DNA repair exonuclease SbcCD ATPase subunit